jgi:nitroreductase
MKYNLSEISELIKDRRTIYPEDYSERIVHKEIINTLLNSALWAPSHGMTQPWRFKVFYGAGRSKLAEFLPQLYQQLTPSDQLKQRKVSAMGTRPLLASAVIAVCMERDPNRKIREIEEIEAVACGVQNLLLHAAAYGLGAYWSSPAICYTPEMNAFLSLGEDDKCLGFVHLGYPKGEWPKSHRKPLEFVSEWIEE